MSVDAVREAKKNRSNSATKTTEAAEPALGSSNADQFFGMVEQAPLTKFFVQPDGTISYLNRKGHEVLRSLAGALGFGPEELVGGSIDRVYAILPELEEASRHLTEQKIVRVHLGDETLDIYLIPLTDENGHSIGLFHGWDVITERIQSEEAVIDAVENAKAVNQVLQALTGAKSVDEAAQIALDTGRSAFGWEYGSYWALDESDHTLKFSVESGSVNNEFRSVTEAASFAEGVGLSGKAWRDRDLVFVKNLGEMADCCRAPVALRAGVKSGVCFPIIQNNRVVGTMDFFSMQTLDPSQERLDALRNMGRLVSGTLESLGQQDGVKDAAKNAQAVNQILQALATATTVGEAAQIALDNGREAYGMDYGSFWELDESDNTLKFSVESGSVNEEFRRVTEAASFAEGVGLSGRAWRDRDLVFVDDLGKMTDCCRAPVALRAGVKSGVCFPIIKNGRVVGTMDFFSMQTLEPSEERLESIRNVGRLVSGTLESLEQQEAAARAQSMIENAPINIVFADTDYQIMYVNPASVATLKTLEHLLPIPVDQIVGQSIDIFHKNPEHQRGLLDDPKNLPHRAKIAMGEETLDLLASAISDSSGKRIGTMVTWSVVTGQVKMADDFEKNVKGVVGIVTSAATELQASAKSMAATAEETSRQSQVVAAASEEATKNVETVSSAAEELSASISEISRHVQEASRMTQQAVAQAEETNVTIKDLGESSNEIGQVIKVITSIAQQTNLLALNATIEAARAGEAGKGFAVVANEVKELARQTAKATEEISEKIGAIQGATGGAAAAIESIGQSISKINEISTTIASAVEEQTAATNEISRNVSEAARGTAEVTSNIAGVSQAADESGRGASDIQAAADGLSQESATLDTVTDGFLKQLRAL